MHDKEDIQLNYINSSNYKKIYKFGNKRGSKSTVPEKENEEEKEISSAAFQNLHNPEERPCYCSKDHPIIKCEEKSI